jgi:hypothetical protein
MIIIIITDEKIRKRKQKPKTSVNGTTADPVIYIKTWLRWPVFSVSSACAQRRSAICCGYVQEKKRETKGDFCSFFKEKRRRDGKCFASLHTHTHTHAQRHEKRKMRFER